MLDKWRVFFSDVLNTQERVYLIYLGGILLLGWYLYASRSAELAQTRQELEIRKLIREALRDEG